METNLKSVKEIMDEMAKDFCGAMCILPEKCLRETAGDEIAARKLLREKHCENCPMNRAKGDA